MHGAPGLQHGQDIRQSIPATSVHHPRGDSWEDDRLCEYICRYVTETGVCVCVLPAKHCAICNS